MRISYKWLKYYLDINLTPEELENSLTFAGIEVEAVEKLGQELSSIIVAEIINKEKHPDAEKLSVCTVFDGNENLQIVCGAPNCAKGKKVALAPIGATIGNFKIKKAKLRGVQSFGMLCSEKELNISNNHDGIMLLPDDAKVGISLNNFLGFDDTVYEVEITPNRPDLLGMMGVAKDLAALLSKKANNPYLQAYINVTPEFDFKIENNASKVCPRYTARVIKGVKVQASPEWLVNCLTACGLRSINNIVDITNFVMMEYGHPVHAFDLNKISGNKIIIRKALNDEKFIALDDNEYKLNSDDLVIADTEKAIALAGVIGGANSNIDDNTIDIVIEAANFAYSSVRKTSRHHKIFTDSSYRFERGMSSHKVQLIANRVSQLVLELAGGTDVTGLVDNYLDIQEKNKVCLRINQIKRILNINLTNNEVKNYLLPLGLQLVSETSEKLTFLAPYDRPDLTREIDLLEELMRLYGYNNYEKQPEKKAIMNKCEFFALRDIKDVMADCGFYEAYNLSYSDAENLNLLKIEEDNPLRDTVNILNPMGSSFSIMRSSLLPALLKNLLFNVNHGEKDVKLFELGKVFKKGNGSLAIEENNLCGVITGLQQPAYWQQTNKQSDFFTAKGAIESIFEQLKISGLKWKHYSNSYLIDGQSAAVYFKKNMLATCGRLDAKIAEAFGIDVTVWVINIYIDKILKLAYKAKDVFKEIPKIQPIQRDISFVVDCKHDVQSIAKTIISSNPKLIKKVVLFDEYKGKGISAGMRSLSFNLFISSSTKTLTDEFILQLFDRVKTNLEKAYQIQMR